MSTNIPDLQVLRAMVEGAELVFAVDHVTKGETVFYGAHRLKRIIFEGSEMLKVLKVEVDWDSDDPEILAAACLEIKGQCDHPTEAE